MATYLLLRDNKQSGPYTFDELKVKGLKAYDLVWVENRSAAWRYPGEVDELKPFSPEVVEQPFDRFYKRPSQENKPAVAAKQNTAVSEKEVNAPAAQQAVIQTGSRNIYVTLPSTAKKTETPREPFIPQQETVNNEYVVKESAKPDFIRQTTPMVPLSVKEEYHEQPETHNHYSNNKSRPVNHDSFSLTGLKKPVLTAVSVVLLLGIGVFIGLYISKVSSNPSPKNYNAVTKGQPEINQQAISPTTSIPVSEKVDEPKTNSIVPQDNTKNLVSSDPQADKKTTVVTEKKKTIVPKEKPEVIPPVSTGATPPDTNSEASVLPGMQHREATHRTDPAPDKDAAKTSLLALVSVDANKYSVGTFGGISELQLTVNNRSTHPLDLVVVEVQYIQANRKIFKTENLYFRNINAGSALMQEAPKSPRGIKIQYKVTLINSKEPGLSYSGL